MSLSLCVCLSGALQFPDTHILRPSAWPPSLPAGLSTQLASSWEPSSCSWETFTHMCLMLQNPPCIGQSWGHQTLRVHDSAEPASGSQFQAKEGMAQLEQRPPPQGWWRWGPRTRMPRGPSAHHHPSWCTVGESSTCCPRCPRATHLDCGKIPSVGAKLHRPPQPF